MPPPPSHPTPTSSHPTPRPPAALAPKAKALRDGTVQTVDAADLVPGDIVIIRLGDIVPADIKVLKEEGSSGKPEDETPLQVGGWVPLCWCWVVGRDLRVGQCLRGGPGWFGWLCCRARRCGSPAWDCLAEQTRSFPRHHTRLPPPFPPPCPRPVLFRSATRPPSPASPCPSRSLAATLPSPVSNGQEERCYWRLCLPAWSAGPRAAHLGRKRCRQSRVPCPTCC